MKETKEFRFNCCEVNAAGEHTVYEVTASQPADYSIRPLGEHREWRYVIESLNLPLIKKHSNRFYDVLRTGRVFRVVRGSQSTASAR